MVQDQAELRSQIQALLDKAKRCNLDGFEISAHIEQGFVATARMGSLENLEHHREKALKITVYKDQRVGSASAADFSSQTLDQVLKQARSIASYAEKDDCSGLPEKCLLAFDYPDLDLYHSWNLSPSQAIALAVRADKAARTADTRINQTEESTVSTSRHFRIYANSNDFLGDYEISMHGQSISLVAEQKGVMERDYDYRYSHLASDLASPEALAEQAVARTVDRLGAVKLSTRQCPVIFEKRVARSLIGHFLSAISGTSLYRRTSFLTDQIEKKLFPEFVNIYQRPHECGAYGSAPFDNQGVKTQDLSYVMDGRITHYILGNYSAKKLGLTSTGNAGGVFNLYLSDSGQDLKALCHQMGTGLLVTELLGQGVNLLTGDYSRGAAGFWVENGAIKCPVHEVTIAGNLNDMFANIVAIGNDADRLTNIHTGSILIEQMTLAGLN